jgi:murein DD-endopeptidase MepM/ murein hydrolase activator NlpD
MRARAIGIFCLGFLGGALAVYYILWRTGGLVPGRLLTRTTHELTSGEPSTPRPLPTIPFPTPTTAPAIAVPTSPTAEPAATLLAPATPPPLQTPLLANFSLTPDALVLPVEGAKRSDLHDSFAETRGTRRHEAIDILAPRGTPVVAAVDGSIAKLFTSVQGGLTVYEFDGKSVYCYYYAHLDRYAEGLKEGQRVRRGERIGYVGTTGDAPPNTPHLHFAVTRLGQDKRWWEGISINPYPMLLAAAPKD